MAAGGRVFLLDLQLVVGRILPVCFGRLQTHDGIIRGIFNSFGAFQAFYQEHILSGTPASTISWIGSVEGALLLMGGLFTGPIFDLGFFRVLASFGSLIIVFGMMMLSLSTKYYQVITV